MIDAGHIQVLRDELQAFLREPWSREFREEAEHAFLTVQGSTRSREPDEAAAVEDYAIFDHRDSQGRTLADRFIEARRDELDDEALRALDDSSRSFFGGFVVETIDWTRGFVLRRLGTEDRFELVPSEHDFDEGSVVFARLVPAGASFELAFVARELPSYAAPGAERMVSRSLEAGIDPFSHTSTAHEILAGLSSKRTTGAEGLANGSSSRSSPASARHPAAEARSETSSTPARRERRRLESPSPRGRTIRRHQTKVGRNDPCPCGSGAKYKKCCGQ